MSSAGPPVVRAGGVLPVRVRQGALQVALVHRPRYDDWSWPKGKLERGEDYPVAAVRETWEETGLRVRLGAPLPVSRYRLASGSDKVVHYWAGEVVGGQGALEHEVDEVCWLSPTLAGRRLSYDRDREQLAAVVDLYGAERLPTWTFLVVRHALAIARGDWSGPDPLRPLTGPGRRRSAHRLADLLAAYGPEQLLSSTSVRCSDTLAPFARSAGLSVTTRKGLSEEGFESDPRKLRKHLGRVLEAGVSTALCTHGPLLPDLVGALLERTAPGMERSGVRVLRRLTEVTMDKGEVLACTMTGSGAAAQVLSATRYRPR
ncbi:NUDIX domain-containing protein [uncultured Serinicoccus sp.]|uniref:NUDIX hydrolase n=1 Tax=uncultured Serinicoccus sp. TaxID=735514 RepID=UPI002634907B|nr:NUDIX domain-containing protein [uncultured Serinicoccus sp.]